MVRIRERDVIRRALTALINDIIYSANAEENEDDIDAEEKRLLEKAKKMLPKYGG